MKAIVKTITMLLFVVVAFSPVYADDTQDLKSIYNTFLPDFQKLTPEAAALGQYGNYQSSGYSGVPNISIPLFNISSGHFSMPVDLCYDASGIKVEQQATYVGLAWNLTMGGSISQIVCGKNDFTNRNPYNISNLDLLHEILPLVGYSPDYCLKAYPVIRYPGLPNGPGEALPLEEDRRKSDILKDVSNGSRVPDIFQASFCGHSVYFVIDSEQKLPKIIGNDATAYKIELVDYISYPHRIVITDDHGFKYIFIEAPKKTMEDNASYNLSEVKNAAGRVLARFSYSEVSYTLLGSYYETMGKRNENSLYPIASQTLYDTFIKKNYPSTLVSDMREYYPDTITTDKEIVVFSYGTREDIKNTKRIDRITVMSRNEKYRIIHTIDFDYDYFTESPSDYELINRYKYTYLYAYKRLKLTGITIDGKKYAFDYNNNPLPPRLCKGQDFWGYYNGELNNDGFCSAPGYMYDNEENLLKVETVGPANRYASEYNCKVGILNMITYPTGGYTMFDFEINHFNDVGGKYYYPSAKSNVEYVRTEICSSGYNGRGYNTTPDTKSFSVSKPSKVEIASGAPYYPAIDKYYKLNLSIVGKDDAGNVVFSRYYTKYNDKQDFKESCILPAGHYVLSSQFTAVNKGVFVGGRIQVSFEPELIKDPSLIDASGKSIGGGLRIKTITNYNSDGTLMGYTNYKYDDGKLLIPTVKEEYIKMIYPHGFGFTPHSNTMAEGIPCDFDFISSSPSNLAVCSLGSPNVGYSKITKENYDRTGTLISYDIEKFHNEGYSDAGYNIFRLNMDGLNGKITESMTYSKDDVLMHKTSYSYNTLGSYPSLDEMVFFPWARCTDTNPGSSALDVYYKYALYSKAPRNVVPSVVTETNYVDGNPQNSVSTSYAYKKSNYQATSVTKSFSIGSNTSESSQVKYWYPEDLEVISSNPSCLLDAHCISEQVKAVEYKNGNTTGGYRNVYKVLANGLPVVSKNYSITQSEHEVMELDVTDYDIYGNIREYVKKDGTPVTIIWSYSHQVPVMEILGVTYSDIFMRFSDVARLENGILASDIINTTESLYSALREQGIMVTAYEYSPWYTVTCVITPNGNKNRYSYDSYGRLEKISDINNRLQQKYSYNYGTK